MPISTNARVGRFEQLVCTILTGVIQDLDDRWIDELEELIDHTHLDFDLQDPEEQMDKYDAAIDELQKKAMARVGKALVNFGEGESDRLLDIVMETIQGTRAVDPPLVITSVAPDLPMHYDGGIAGG